MRLTKQNATFEGTTVAMPTAVRCYWRLKEYEDKEDELGVGILTIIEAFENGIIVKTKSGFDGFYEGSSLLFKGNGFAIAGKPHSKKFLFKDFGNTWLTDGVFGKKKTKKTK